jgi:sulfur carrier protein
MQRCRRRRLRRHPALSVIALKVNGKHIELDAPMPLTDYLNILGVSPRAVAVEHNGVIIERDAYATTTLRDGDVVEIVRMVGGGRDRALHRQPELLPNRGFGLSPLVPGF